MKSVLDAMPLFLLDDLLNITTTTLLQNTLVFVFSSKGAIASISRLFFFAAVTVKAAVVAFSFFVVTFCQAVFATIFQTNC